MKYVCIDTIKTRLRRDVNEANTELLDDDEYELENEDSDRPERVKRYASNHAYDLQNEVKKLNYDTK